MGFFSRPQASAPEQGQNASQSLRNPVNMVNDIEQNPALLGQTNWNIPQGMTDGDQILQHLVNTGQVNPALVQNPFVMGLARAISSLRHQ